jgi:lipoprotein-releasing system permease protein
VPIEVFLALRFMREGRAQSVLIIVGAAVGVAVIVFLSSLITGLQARLIEQTLGTQAHVVIRPREEEARSLRVPDRGEAILARVVPPAQRVRSIADWPAQVRALEAMPGIVAISPAATGAAFALRGSASRTIALYGVDPARFARIYAIEGEMIAGRFAPGGGDAVIGVELADDLGVGLGDRLRIEAAEGRSTIARVGGIFDLGNRDVNRRWVIVSMRAAQTLLDLAGGASVLELRVSEIFEADNIAARAQGRTGLVAESWMQTNGQLLVALRSQAASSNMIQFFVVLAVALGIASVLVVSVVQRSRQIGILRAMGAPRGQVLRIFLVQGALVGVLGSVVGSALGAGLAAFFATLAVGPDGAPLFPADIAPALVFRTAAIATVVGLLASVVPARRAARLDPAEAIRGE